MQFKTFRIAPGVGSHGLTLPCYYHVGDMFRKKQALRSLHLSVKEESIILSSAVSVDIFTLHGYDIIVITTTPFSFSLASTKKTILQICSCMSNTIGATCLLVISTRVQPWQFLLCSCCSMFTVLYRVLWTCSSFHRFPFLSWRFCIDLNASLMYAVSCPLKYCGYNFFGQSWPMLIWLFSSRLLFVILLLYPQLSAHLWIELLCLILKICITNNNVTIVEWICCFIRFQTLLTVYMNTMFCFFFFIACCFTMEFSKYRL